MPDQQSEEPSSSIMRHSVPHLISLFLERRFPSSEGRFLYERLAFLRVRGLSSTFTNFTTGPTADDAVQGRFLCV